MCPDVSGAKLNLPLIMSTLWQLTVPKKENSI